MTATVFYDSVNEIALISNTFLNSSGVAADPTTVTCIITDPSAASVTHTYAGAAPADITKISPGKYTLAVPCSPAVAGVDGLWGFEWIGTGAVSDVQPGTWRVLPPNISQLWYVGSEEMNDRLGITDLADSAVMQTSIAASAGWINEYCVVMDTPILTADLRWVPAGDLVLGQELVGVDEEPAALRPMANGAAKWLRGTNHSRYYRRAEVLATPRRKTECTRLILADSREVTCATDHRWLARRRQPGRGGYDGYHWMHTRELASGDEISAPLRTWPEETGFEAGWMSGLFDGEGWFASSTPTHTRIGVAQNPGPVLDGIIKYLDNAGIPYYQTRGTSNLGQGICVGTEIGARWAVMELVGRLRPRRFLPRANRIWEGRSMVGSGRSNVRIAAAEPAGIREVVSLGTSTGTYIANGLISHNCGRHFNRVTETRTFVPYDIYELDIDDIVPGSAIALSVDFDGDGTYEQAWTLGTDYQLYLGRDRFNTGSTGTPRPYEKARVITSGRTFPFLWPFSPLNRVQAITTWGWPSVPWQVAEANRILAADLFKSKDAPFGVAGVSDIGIVRIQSNPWLTELLQRFVKGRQKVGV